MQYSAYSSRLTLEDEALGLKRAGAPKALQCWPGPLPTTLPATLFLTLYKHNTC